VGAAVRSVVLRGDARRAALRRAGCYLVGPDRLALRRGAVPRAVPNVPHLARGEP
jgi:hypothetical protein